MKMHHVTTVRIMSRGVEKGPFNLPHPSAVRLGQGETLWVLWALATPGARLAGPLQGLGSREGDGPRPDHSVRVGCWAPSGRLATPALLTPLGTPAPGSGKQKKTVTFSSVPTDTRVQVWCVQARGTRACVCTGTRAQTCAQAHTQTHAHRGTCADTHYGHTHVHTQPHNYSRVCM